MKKLILILLALLAICDQSHAASKEALEDAKLSHKLSADLELANKKFKKNAKVDTHYLNGCEDNNPKNRTPKSYKKVYLYSYNEELAELDEELPPGFYPCPE